MKKLCVTVLYVFFTAVLLPCIVWVAWRGDTKINSGSSAVEYDITKKGRAVDSLESYVASVVAAEMPASYGIEALKAQAVATRTYAVFHGYEGDGEQIAQAFLSEDEKKDRWGTDFEFYDNKIKEAVAATEGEILTVDGHPINAVFHAMSAGATEFAENVWKNPSDCLVAVPCTEDETSPDFLSYVSFTAEEFLSIVSSAGIEFSPAQIEITTRSQSGYVLEINIGKSILTGVEARSLFGLKSSCFSVTFSKKESSVVFAVKGYGHGVGMSQYAAGVIAKNGGNYKNILAKFYPGSNIAQFHQ